MKNFVSKLKKKCIRFKRQRQIGYTQFVTFPQIEKRITQINLIVHFFSVIPLQSGAMCTYMIKNSHQLYAIFILAASKRCTLYIVIIPSTNLIDSKTKVIRFNFSVLKSAWQITYNVFVIQFVILIKILLKGFFSYIKMCSKTGFMSSLVARSRY